VFLGQLSRAQYEPLESADNQPRTAMFHQSQIEDLLGT
jgi:hypothetical protein